MIMSEIKLFENKLLRLHEHALEDYERMKEKFAANPSHALQWGDSLFETAAKYDVAQKLYDHWFNFNGAEPDREKMIKGIELELRRIVCNKAQQLSNRSSGQAPNLYDDAILSATAKVLELFFSEI